MLGLIEPSTSKSLSENKMSNNKVLKPTSDDILNTRIFQYCSYVSSRYLDINARFSADANNQYFYIMLQYMTGAERCVGNYLRRSVKRSLIGKVTLRITFEKLWEEIQESSYYAK